MCEDLTKLHLHELNEPAPDTQLLAWRIRDRNEDCVVEAKKMAEAVRLANKVVHG
jgi:hypothetical protein